MPATEGSFWQANDNVAGEEIAKVVFSILTHYMQSFGKANSLSRILAFHRQSCNSKQIPERAHSIHALLMRKNVELQEFKQVEKI